MVEMIMISGATCMVDGCLRVEYCRGWCVKHYRAWQRHGDPGMVMVKQRAKHGERDMVMAMAMAMDGDNCIRWQFGHGDRVARKILTITKGPPPSPSYECSHLCGNGHLPCINHHHLIWQTRTDNINHQPPSSLSLPTITIKPKPPSRS
jgi:hypothetical protein